jgi:hypothetical protein
VNNSSNERRLLDEQPPLPHFPEKPRHESQRDHDPESVLLLAD